MFKFFYVLLLICNTSTNECKFIEHDYHPPLLKLECDRILEEDLEKAFHYKDTTVKGICIEKPSKSI